MSLREKRAGESLAALTPPTADTAESALSPGHRARPDVGPATLLPGAVFAGRYRIVAPLGREEKEGTGVLFQADDLTLQIRVALKLMDPGSPEAGERILAEWRRAQQVTHPAICRVFDVGEADSKVFCSMELVGGEDLATLLRRVGRFAPEKAVEIAHQICAGLTAAHAQGVVHRDLKPSNVLIDGNGAVRITDFGIGWAARDEPRGRAQAGEGEATRDQLVGMAASEQTDLYALGALLYELLVGSPPFKDAGARRQPAKFAHLVPSIDPRLERAVLRALSENPRERPSSAAAMAATLPLLSTTGRQRSIRPWLAGAALAASVGLIAVLAGLLSPHPTVLSSQDTIVLAEFDNSTGDPVFDGALKVALAVALEQSPFLKVFPDDRVRETLTLMQRSPDERVTRATAREIARREQLKALVTGSIGRLGDRYVLALEAINAETADVMAREQVEASAKEQVLALLGAATTRLRERLGESLASVQKFDAPLARATTFSIDALHAYSLALDQGRIVPRVEAIPHLKRAIELDPNFAMAHALLSGVYANTGRWAEAPEHSRKAFELRDRVSERERFFIAWRYYLDAEQAWDQALELARSWSETYPREAFAFNSLGLASAAFGQHEPAVTAFREAIRLDSKFVPPYGNLAGSLLASNRLADAKTALGEAAAHGIGFISVRRMSYVLAFLENDPQAMARELALTRGSPEGSWALNWAARTAAFGGRVQAAHALFRQGAEAASRESLHELSAQWTMEDAESHAIVGQCQQAGQEVGAGLRSSRDNFTLERAVRTLALCDDKAAAELLHELTDRFRTATLTTRIQLPVAAAALAVRRGEAAGALKILEPVAPYDHAPASEFWPAYLRGQASLQLKNGSAAALAFQNIIDRRGEAPTSPLFALAHLGLARAAVLNGDATKARAAYDRFFTLWNAADSTLPPLREARQEYAQLR